MNVEEVSGNDFRDMILEKSQDFLETFRTVCHTIWYKLLFMK